MSIKNMQNMHFFLDIAPDRCKMALNNHTKPRRATL
jgi:hypothetical protein